MWTNVYPQSISGMAKTYDLRSEYEGCSIPDKEDIRIDIVKI